jgi:protein-S-isoprenylcysteine O-methyltransferase Ste14
MNHCATGVWSVSATSTTAPVFGRAHRGRGRLHDLFTRTFGGVWFLSLAAVMVVGTTAPGVPWSQIISRSCLCLFYLLLWLLILIRPPARSEAVGWLPRLAAFVGTYLPWSITFLAPNAGVGPNLLSTVCVTGGMILVIITVLHLGRSFSLVPQARAVACTGPYRWIRHPLYFAEEIAVLGVVLQVLSPLTLTIFVTHIAVQIGRIHFEEHLLRQSLPEYHRYGQIARWRLIPHIW